MSSHDPDQSPYQSRDDDTTTLEDEEWQDDGLDTEGSSLEEDDEQDSESGDEPYQPAPLSGISLELTVRSGSVTLTLDALQRLAPGAVIEVAGITPGYATLCHGERVVAEGELVDVDGRLGLQITRMAFDR